MTSPYFKTLQDLKEQQCHQCQGRGRQHNNLLMCTTCYGTGFQTQPLRNTQHNITNIIEDLVDGMASNGHQVIISAIARLTQSEQSVRNVAIGWTWTRACQAYAQGLDPHRSSILDLLDAAKADLNPVADKNERPA